MPLRFRLSASPFCASSARLQAAFLAERGLILVLHRLDDLAELAPQLGVGDLDGRADLDHLRVPFAVALGELRLLPLQIGEIAAELLDVVVRRAPPGRCRACRWPSAAFSWL